MIFPKLRYCGECGSFVDGSHQSWCQSRGYANVGPHPSAPPAPAPRKVDPTPCPCGIARADCEYHR